MNKGLEFGGASGGSASQTPWTSNIDAAGYTLIGNSASGGNLTLIASSHGTVGSIIASGASIVSTPAFTMTGAWYTGGSATTTKPHLLIEPTGTTSTSWSTAGTGLGINAASGFTGDFLNLQINGVSKFTLSSTGAITTPSIAVAFSTGGGYLGNVTGNYGIFGYTNGNHPAVRVYPVQSTANAISLVAGVGNSSTSGNFVFTTIAPSYNQASGTAANTDLLINRTQTAVGSGAQLLLDAQVGSASKFSVSSAGVAKAITLQAAGDVTGIASTATITNATDTTTTNAYVVGGGQAATTKNTGWLKIYIGTAVAWIPYWTNATP